MVFDWVLSTMHLAFGRANVTIYFDVINAEPRPALSVTVTRENKTLTRLRPYREPHLGRPYCLSIDGQDYWLLLKPHYV